MVNVLAHANDNTQCRKAKQDCNRMIEWGQMRGEGEGNAE